MIIYCVEKVDYDYYRFDEVIGAALTKEKAVAIAEKWKAKNEWAGDIKIEIENEGYDCAKYDRPELSHLYISLFDSEQ